MIIINESLSDQYTNRVIQSFKDFNPKDYCDKLSEQDMKNPSKVKRVIPFGTVSNGSCSGYAGKVARMMDYYGLDYEIYNGLAVSKSMMSKKFYDTTKVDQDELKHRKFCNHTWLKHDGNYYETYPSDTEHLYYIDKFTL